MSETIFIVFIIIIILVVGITIFSKFQAVELKEQQKVGKDKQVATLAHTLSSWSELECRLADATEVNCFDITKVAVFSEYIEEAKASNGYAFEYYFTLLKNSRIKIREVYPDKGREWLLYDNPGRGINAIPVYLPINLYDPFTKTYSLGIMEIINA